MTVTQAKLHPLEPFGLNGLRCLFIGSNLIVLCGGLALFGIAIWILSSTESFQMLVVDSKLIVHSVNIIIASGFLLCFIGFLGCCGGVLMNKLMLLNFFALLFFLFAFNVIGSTLAFVFYERLQQMAVGSLEYYNNTKARYGREITTGWNEVQSVLQCCGVNGREDWLRYTNNPPPPCAENDKDKNDETIPGCERAIAPYLLALGAIGTVVAISQLSGMLFACVLYHRQLELEANAPKVEISYHNKTNATAPAKQNEASAQQSIEIKKIIAGATFKAQTSP